MVLCQVILLFYYFILALDKYSRNYKIQLISSQLILLPYMRRKKIRYKKALARELFYYMDYFTGYF